VVQRGGSWTKESEDNLNTVGVRGEDGWAVGAKGVVLRKSGP
jgi:hypothetical protein